MSSTLKNIELAPVMRFHPRDGAIIDQKSRLFDGQRGYYIEPDSNGVDLLVIHMLARLRLNESLVGTIEEAVVDVGMDPTKFSEGLGRDLDEKMSVAASRIGLESEIPAFGTLLGRNYMVQFVAGVVSQRFTPKTLIGITSILEREQMLTQKLYVPSKSLSFEDSNHVKNVANLLGKFSSRLRQAPGSGFGSY